MGTDSSLEEDVGPPVSAGDFLIGLGCPRGKESPFYLP
jgi:hypothetical protein